jgi:hypothetical protein
MGQMNRDEKVAREYLMHLGHREIVYEPDGNKPPDFLVAGRIAVEVRRLNQNEVIGSKVRGLEEVSIPFLMKFKTFLRSLGPSKGRSWHVSYARRGPLPPWYQLERELRTYLEAVRDSPREHQSGFGTAHETFKVQLFRASKPHPDCFILGWPDDADSGDLVVAEMLKNLHICIEQKTRKIAAVRHRYPAWWLVLIDRIAFGELDGHEQQLLREQLKVSHSWDKVIVVNPLDPRSALELE